MPIPQLQRPSAILYFFTFVKTVLALNCEVTGIDMYVRCLAARFSVCYVSLIAKWALSFLAF
jgi:hypothetical protein